MTKRLRLRKETLSALSNLELDSVVAAAYTENCPQLTIGGSCGIVCHSAGLQCFTDNC